MPGFFLFRRPIIQDGVAEMSLSFMFVLNCALLGVGLSMDAFSVSMVNGLNEPRMGVRRGCAVAGVYAFFQALMPMTGWVCVRTIVEIFRSFQKAVPWIALILLLGISGKMVLEGLRGGREDCAAPRLTPGALFLQGVATSIDALSVGFTIAAYDCAAALAASLIISTVTFAVCGAGLLIGKKIGTALSGRATILGGVILIGIGLEIFAAGVL